MGDKLKDIKCPECTKDIPGIERESHIAYHWGDSWKDNVPENSEAMKRINVLRGDN